MSAPQTLQNAIVKSVCNFLNFIFEKNNDFLNEKVQSGDSIIIRSQPKGGPPPEKQINLGKC